MLEVMREYKHLAAKKRAEGALSPELEGRFQELEVLVRSGREEAPGKDPGHVRGSRTQGSAASSGREAQKTPLVMPAASALPLPSGEVKTPFGIRGLFPKETKKRRRAMFMVAGGLLLMSILLPIAIGLPGELLQGVIIERLMLFGGLFWGLLYPGWMAFREYAARKSRAHIIEPDFEVSIPVVEPVILALSLLATFFWLAFAGGVMESLSIVVAYVLGFVLGNIGLGAAATEIVRPIATKIAHQRAYPQYLEGAATSLAKNNPRRARRLLERALNIVETREQREELYSRLENAALSEAEALRRRGHDKKADEVLENARKWRKQRASKSSKSQKNTSKQKVSIKPRSSKPVVVPTSLSAPTSKKAVSTQVVSRKPSGPKLLKLDGVTIGSLDRAPDDSSEVKTCRDRAKTLLSREQPREALEVLVEGGLAVPRDVAEAAAEEYIALGLLRSAFVIFKTLNQPKIPEFYKAAAVEWVRAEEALDPELGIALLDALVALDQLQAAARVACQAALAEDLNQEHRMLLADQAMKIFAQMGQGAPPELHEVRGDYLAAARAYEAEQRNDDVIRCYKLSADSLIAEGNQQKLLPLLSKLFHLEPQLEDEYLKPMVEHVLENKSSSPGAIKVLTSYRKRHRDDDKVGFRLFHIHMASGKPDDALKELEIVAEKVTGDPASIVSDYQKMVERFPDHFQARVGFCRMLIRAGKIGQAAQVAERLIALEYEAVSSERQKILYEVLQSLVEWGHPDNELRKELGLLELAMGQEQKGLNSLEDYVTEGGRDGKVLQQVDRILRPSLVTTAGGPNYQAYVKLATFYLYGGKPAGAIPCLEVLRGSAEYQAEAIILLGRAELLSSNPKQAVKVFFEAIDGRHVGDTPELHFELARAYESIGDPAKAKRIDQAIEQVTPGFAREYLERRPVFERSETSWMAAAKGSEPADTEIAPVLSDSTLDETPAAAEQQDPRKGLSEVLAPRYKLIRRLGSGGMGEVHLAEDLALGREVAVKVLRRSLATDLFIAKFKDEARIVAQLSHSGIVQVYDIGQEGEWSYIVMEYVRGPNLATLLSSSVPPPRSLVIEYIAQVADAMAYAHRRGVIHRDLKPANILVGVDGKVKVTDFGIARVLQGSKDEQTAFSAAGLQVGTVNYMAPEQIDHDLADARTDVYLLGTTLYYCLSKRYPFRGGAALKRKAVEEAPRISNYLPDVSLALDGWIAKCIARRPQERFQTMDEIADSLRALPDTSQSEDQTLLAAALPD